jgi:hypothetical protein
MDFGDPGASEGHAKKVVIFGKSQSKRKTWMFPMPAFGPSQPAQTYRHWRLDFWKKRAMFNKSSLFERNEKAREAHRKHV